MAFTTPTGSYGDRRVERTSLRIASPRVPGVGVRGDSEVFATTTLTRISVLVFFVGVDRATVDVPSSSSFFAARRSAATAATSSGFFAEAETTAFSESLPAARISLSAFTVILDGSDAAVAPLSGAQCDTNGTCSRTTFFAAALFDRATVDVPSSSSFFAPAPDDGFATEGNCPYERTSGWS